MHKKEKIDWATRWPRAKELHQTHKLHARNVYAKQITHTVNSTLVFFPPSLIKRMQKELCTAGQSLEKEILDRTAILPTKAYRELDELFEGKSTTGWHYNRYSFINETTLSRKGVLDTVVHELVHLMERSTGIKHTTQSGEICATALPLYLRSLISAKQRKNAIKSSELPPHKDAPASESRRIGNQTFRLADEIRTRKGEERAKQFFWDLFLSKTLGIRDIKKAYDKAITT